LTSWYWVCAGVKEAVVEGQVAQAELHTQAVASAAAPLHPAPSTDSQPGDRRERGDTPEGTPDVEDDAEAAETKPKRKGRAKGHKLPPGELADVFLLHLADCHISCSHQS